MKDIIRHWRLREPLLKMEGTKLSCGHVCFPPRSTCPICEALKLETIPKNEEKPDLVLNAR